MEDQNIQDFVGSLSSVIKEVQKNIQGLSDVTADFKKQLEQQGKNVDDNTERSKGVFESVNNFTQLVIHQNEELKMRFQDLSDKQLESEKDISVLISMNKDTLENMIQNSSVMEIEYNNLLQKVIKQSQDLQSHLGESLDGWTAKSELLVSDFNARLVTIEDKITVELDNVGITMSKKLEPTLGYLIKALSETHTKVEKTRKLVLVFTIISAIALILAVVLVVFVV